MSRRLGDTLARIVVACLCLGLYGADCFSKLPSPADAPHRSSICRRIVARRLRTADLWQASRRLSRILSQFTSAEPMCSSLLFFLQAPLLRACARSDSKSALPP